MATRVTQLIADLVEPARVTALEQLGEGWRAFGIATGWLRGKLVEAPVEESAPLQQSYGQPCRRGS